ncbi:MAG TPA: glycosyltransferase family 4 protein [Acidimicrobiales bacterium]|nr:glycosyltransferase family 4 protein [Acidimicrobiales bacterium]
MRILLLTPVPPDRDAPGAIPALVHAALVGLSIDHDVVLVTPAGPDPAELAAADRLRSEGWQVHAVPRHLDRRRWRRRARMSGAWLRGRLPWRTVWFHEPAVQAELDTLLARGGFDVVAVEDNSMATYDLPTTVATVLTEHEVRRPRPVDWHAGPLRQWPEWAFREYDWHRWPRYQRGVWKRFDAVQVFTDRDARALAEVAPNLASRVHVAPFGIELPSHTTDALPEPDSIAFIGNYTHPPNVDAALWLARDVLPLVRGRIATATLTLAGLHAPDEVLQLAGRSIEVVGMVEDADAFMRRHAVLAAPVRTGGGMRMKVLHAMSLACAVVTTTRGAEGLRFEGDPPLAIADDAASLADAIIRLLQDDVGRRDVGERARAFVEVNHSPAAVARRLEAVYAAAIETHRTVSP